MPASVSAKYPVSWLRQSNLISLGNGAWVWQAYDPAMKADLSSSAVTSYNRLFVVDPISLGPSPPCGVEDTRACRGVLVTNANHVRAAEAFAQELACDDFCT